jgi:putative FmdB family regulatory protein
MPLYEYLCEACGRKTELLQRFDDPPLTNCPQCGGTVKKQFSAPAFHLKGSGWYATDYAKKAGGGEGAKPEGSKPESSAATPSESPSTGSEAKAGADKPSPAAPSSSSGPTESKS